MGLALFGRIVYSLLNVITLGSGVLFVFFVLFLKNFHSCTWKVQSPAAQASSEMYRGC